VFSDHLDALARRDVAEIVKDYAADAVLITSQGVLEGRAGIEYFYTESLKGLPDIRFHVKATVYAENALLVWWTASASAGHIDDGVDTLTFADGLITLQTSSYVIEPNTPTNAAS
jgi:hypothetical protein